MLVVDNSSLTRDGIAKFVSDFWDSYNQARLNWLGEVNDVRRYTTSMSTADTEVGSLPWKNKTTIPKLTHIADNLVSYYTKALMPNDQWFIWEGANEEAEAKAKPIEDYMRAKLRAINFREEIVKCLRDFVNTGNCWASASWVEEYTLDSESGEKIINYIGPKLSRLSPFNVMMNPKAKSFDKSAVVKRDIVPVYELLDKKSFDQEAVRKVQDIRSGVHEDLVDWYIDNNLSVDGFDSFIDYIGSGYVELLEYYGDIWDKETNTVKHNQKAIIADRCFVLYQGDNPSWNGWKPVVHAGWRQVPDNLYAQGPLHQLIGMQYRCDHLENLKADAFDQIVHPIIKIKGDTVEDFEFGPGKKVFCGDGDVEFLRPDSTVLACDNQVAYYQNLMELFAGSPRESMGFRTPGEKTAFEVDTLQQGADRVFMDKVLSFEESFLERVLNLFYEMIVRNMPVVDIVRVLNDDKKSTTLVQFTKQDVAAHGYLRPVGAKHFSDRNKRMREFQNFVGLIGTIPNMQNHLSALRMGEMMEEELGFEKWNFIEENIGIKEQIASQMVMLQGQQLLGEASGGTTPAEPPQQSA